MGNEVVNYDWNDATSDAGNVADGEPADVMNAALNNAENCSGVFTSHCGVSIGALGKANLLGEGIESLDEVQS